MPLQDSEQTISLKQQYKINTAVYPALDKQQYLSRVGYMLLFINS